MRLLQSVMHTMRTKVRATNCHRRTLPTVKKIYLSILLPLVCLSLSAQSEARSGIVVDQATSQPIPRTSVSVSGKETGVYTQTDGTFALQQLSSGDTLVLSALGYQTYRVAAKELPDTILLEGVAYELPVVRFSAEPEREHVISLGFQRQKMRSSWGMQPGYQFARYIANPFGEEGLLAAATYQFPRGIRGIDCGGLFRVRVYARQPGKDTFHPGLDLLLETVEFATSRKGGFINIPLREYGIAFPPTGLFVGLDYLAPAGKIPIREDGRPAKTVLGLYYTTNGKALTFASFRDGPWATNSLPRWGEHEVPNMAFGAVVVFRR